MELWIKGTAGTTGDCLYHQRKKGLFKDYDDTWLKLKQELAGWPGWCQTFGVRQKWKKPSYLVWLAQGTLDKGCSRYWIGGPTGSGKTLVAAVQCRREVSAFFCSRGTCNGKLHFQMQRYQL